MKKIQDLIKKNISRRDRGEKKELDDKTIARVFLEAAKNAVKNLEDEDIREIKMKNQILYIKTAHPVVSSELLLRREYILEKTNEIAGRKVIDKIIVG